VALRAVRRVDEQLESRDLVGREDVLDALASGHRIDRALEPSGAEVDAPLRRCDRFVPR
jgi:hypothetical protein